MKIHLIFISLQWLCYAMLLVCIKYEYFKLCVELYSFVYFKSLMGFHLIIFSREVARNKSYGRRSPGIRRWIGGCQVNAYPAYTVPEDLAWRHFLY